MPDLRTITEIAPLVQRGRCLARHSRQGCLSAIEARPEVNAFITVLSESALEEATAPKTDIRAGRVQGSAPRHSDRSEGPDPLAGMRTTSGSALPSTEASWTRLSCQRMREAGAILIGKTNLHEFAFGTTSEESAYGPVRNPLDEIAIGWRIERRIGRSAGGGNGVRRVGHRHRRLRSASRRPPAARLASNPRMGEISTVGVVPLSGTLDHVGPMARSVSDVGLMRAVLTDAPADPRLGNNRFTRLRGSASVLLRDAGQRHG